MKFRLVASVPRTSGGGSGLWPTARATDHKTPRGKTGNRTREASHRAGWTLSEAVTFWPTPTANRWSGLQSHGKNLILGKLNPQWVEWLMGYPLGWTDCEGSATPSSRSARSKSSGTLVSHNE